MGEILRQFSQHKVKNFHDGGSEKSELTRLIHTTHYDTALTNTFEWIFIMIKYYLHIVWEVLW